MGVLVFLLSKITRPISRKKRVEIVFNDSHNIFLLTTQTASLFWLAHYNEILALRVYIYTYASARSIVQFVGLSVGTSDPYTDSSLPPYPNVPLVLSPECTAPDLDKHRAVRF